MLLFLKERKPLGGLAHSVAHIRDVAHSLRVLLLGHREAMLAFAEDTQGGAREGGRRFGFLVMALPVVRGVIFSKTFPNATFFTYKISCWRGQAHGILELI